MSLIDTHEKREAMQCILSSADNVMYWAKIMEDLDSFDDLQECLQHLVSGAVRLGAVVPDNQKTDWLDKANMMVKPEPCDKFCTMPTELTAENGAKAALIGEFFEEIKEVCPECGGDHEVFEGGDPECFECDGAGEITRKIHVGWSTIKDIYKEAVKLLGA